MTKYQDPAAGRAKVVENSDTFQISFSSTQNIFHTAFLGFWLCGWLFGELFVLALLVSGGTGGATLFLIGWLGAWTVGGIFGISQFLWGVSGREILTLSGGTLTVRRQIPGYRRIWNYRVGDIQNIRADGALSAAASPFFAFNNLGIFSGKANGTLKFDYGLSTVGFGLNMEEAEAKALAERLSSRIPR